MQPIDYQIDSDFDITKPAVQQQPSFSCYRSAILSAQQWIAVPSLGFVKSVCQEPINLYHSEVKHIHEVCPTCMGGDLQRVVQDNAASDFQLAIQHCQGRGALRENPNRSLHWEDPNEKWLYQQEGWYEYHYDSCCFNSVRKKSQRLRHNMIELCTLPPLHCAHWHDPSEWRPYQDDAGKRVYPSKEEAEYSAALVFTIAAAVSHWAVRQGFAVQKITRLPAVECAGGQTSLAGVGSTHLP